MRTTKTILSILLMIIYVVFVMSVCYTIAAAIVLLAYGNSLNQIINVNMDWWGIIAMFTITIGLLFLWGYIHTQMRKRTINIKPILSVSFMVIYELFLSGIAFITGSMIALAICGKEENIGVNVTWDTVVILLAVTIALYLRKEAIQKRIFRWGKMGLV